MIPETIPATPMQPIVRVPLTFGSLFSGIGGLDLGFERAGLLCKWQVEIDPFARKVLAKHWPNVKRHDDVRTWPEHDTERVDIIAGGFPCQDVSVAGKRAGITGDRSGLYTEILRIVGILRPRIIALENVAALLLDGRMGVVCADMARCGYGCEWATIPASRFGAPHQRDRVFILAYADGERPASSRYFTRSVFESIGEKQTLRARSWPGQREPSQSVQNRFRWLPDSRVQRVADGLPSRVDRDRFRGIGNSVVPQVAEFIGRCLVDRNSQ